MGGRCAEGRREALRSRASSAHSASADTGARFLKFPSPLTSNDRELCGASTSQSVSGRFHL